MAAPLLSASDSALAVEESAKNRVSSAAVVPPALAVENQFDYVKFDVQLSDTESGSFVVEVRPGSLTARGCVCSTPTPTIL